MAKGLTTDRILNLDPEPIFCHEDDERETDFILGRVSGREMFSNGGQGLSVQTYSTHICLMPTMCTVVHEPCHSLGTLPSEETIAPHS